MKCRVEKIAELLVFPFLRDSFKPSPRYLPIFQLRSPTFSGFWILGSAKAAHEKRNFNYYFMDTSLTYVSLSPITMDKD